MMRKEGFFMLCKEKILSEDYYDVITDFPVSAEAAANLDLCVVPVEEGYNLVYIHRNNVVNPNEYYFEHRSMPKLYGLMQGEGGKAAFDPTALIASGITRLQREPLALTGRGCVIAFIDTGINYTDPVFRFPDGSSRILAIWDQTIQTGEPPKGFLYGSEYSREEIDRALEAEDPYALVPTRDEIGHGSDLAAVAAGSNLMEGEQFLGAAPEAWIVVVKLKPCKRYLRDFYLLPEGVPAYEEGDIMLAVQYVDSFARAFQRPVITCIGLGTGQGDHSGNSALAKYLDVVAMRRSRAVIVCGGNEGNSGHHYLGSMDGTQITPRTDVEVRVGEGTKGFLLEFWGGIPDTYTISLRSPGGEVIPAVKVGLREVLTYRFVYERTRVTVAGTLVEPTTGEEWILFRLDAPTPGIWTFRVEAVREVHNGIFHMWLPITQFVSGEVFFLQPTPFGTLTEPGMAEHVITVTGYQAGNNSFYAESGRGFARSGGVKPDLAAPGVNVPVLRGTRSGDSLAAAITAGAAAQFMQWAVVEGNEPVVGSREVKHYFARGAARSESITYPNREWGYGRLDMVGTFNAMIGV